jgi:hypothetical protein
MAGCQECSFTPTIEGFELEPSGYGAFSIASFNEPIEAKEKNYSCQNQKQQSCVYTAQGEVICNMQQQNSVTGGSGFFGR